MRRSKAEIFSTAEAEQNALLFPLPDSYITLAGWRKKGKANNPETAQNLGLILDTEIFDEQLLHLVKIEVTNLLERFCFVCWIFFFGGGGGSAVTQHTDTHLHTQSSFL